MRAKCLPKRELDELAISIVQRETYLAHVSEDPGFMHAFGHMFMLMEDTPTDSQIATIGACYAPMSAAAPRGVNGYPFMLKMHLLHIDDVMPLHWKIMRKQRALDGVPLLRRAMLRVMGR